MKKYIIIISGILSLLWFASCKKALTEKVHSSLTPENFYKTEADAEAALNGVFSSLTAQTYYQRTVYLISDLSCDIFRPNNASSDRQEFYRGTYTSHNGQLYSWWANSYTLIKNANEFIVNLPKVEIGNTKKNNFLGNAFFLRGLAYFELVTIFGDVPLVLNNSGDQNLFPARTSADSVYNQVIADLKFAEANCVHAHEIPADKTGRVSSEAASALLAKVYLQRASTSFAAPTDNQSALDQCNKVINYSIAHQAFLSLAPKYQDVFDINKKNGQECIFSVQFAQVPFSNITNLMFDPESLGGFASFLPLSSFYGSFDPNDQRKTFNAGIIDAGTVYFSKYHDPTTAPGGFGYMNWIILRYADILLMQSEAMNDLNPSDANKFNGINLIRTRAGLGNKVLNFSNTPTSDDFINALVNERLWELCVEGHRRIDLIRLKKFQQIKAAQGFTIDNNHLVMPVPQAELDVNKNLKQNSGF